MVSEKVQMQLQATIFQLSIGLDVGAINLERMVLKTSPGLVYQGLVEQPKFKELSKRELLLRTRL